MVIMYIVHIHVIYAFPITFYVLQQNTSVEFITYKLTFEHHSMQTAL